MNHNASLEESTDLLLDEDVTLGDPSRLIVYNDDFNTFDWVIQSFMEVCNHTYEQSEQLSLIIHFKGRATIKTAPFNVLKPMKDALIDRGLNAVIESLVNE
ncbi:MAG TPA: ATP-dependent Clp protease adaptor ClpS [Saprospiraceae bacterium]|nr:ATP-dependent Clp protease adaptor ClpS [Saprospiraceae bacterium]